MDSATAAALGRLTGRFYERSARGFTAGSERPWPGWVETLERLRPRFAERERMSVLDVGCGNGRLARLLHRSRRGAFTYLGIDASATLLAGAGDRLTGVPDVHFEVRDLLAGPAQEMLPEGAFDLVTLFGVFHHIPGAERRRRLAEALARRVAPGGALALSTWRMSPLSGLAPRLISWEDYNGGAEEPIDGHQLEPHDYLISKPGHGVRYCHLAELDELVQLFAGLPLQFLASFCADGRVQALNLYVLFVSPDRP